LSLNRTLKIPVIQYGNGTPRIFIISGIHGDEDSGPLVLSLLMDKLNHLKISGTITLIPIANTEAIAIKSRLNPIDNKDLNREFGNLGNKTHTTMIAKLIAEIAMTHNLIIDIHTFPNQISPIVGVLLSEGGQEIREVSEKLLNLFQPEIIWNLDSKKTEIGKAGSICSLAITNNLPAFGIELPPNYFLSGKNIQKFLHGFLNIFAEMGIIPIAKRKITKTEIEHFERQMFRSIAEGYFFPEKNIMSNVQKNDLIGFMLALETNEKIKIFSPFKGILLSVSHPRLIKKGEKVFVVGEKVK